MADKFMYIPNDDTQSTLSVDEDKWLKRLNNQLNEPTNQNSIKVPKVVKRCQENVILRLVCLGG